MKRLVSMTGVAAVMVVVCGLALCQGQGVAEKEVKAEEAVAAPAPYGSREEQERAAAEGRRLLGEMKRQAEAGDWEGFYGTVDDCCDDYEGDPAPLLEEAWRLCPKERQGPLAYRSLKLGVRREESVALLRQVVRDKTIPEETEGHRRDARIMAARGLCFAGAKEAAEDIWALYQERGDRHLPLLMAEYLEDERPRTLVAAVTLDQDGWIENLELLGRCRVKEAVPALEKQAARLKERAAGYQPTLNPRLLETLAALYRINGDEGAVKYLLDHADNDPRAMSFLGGTKRRDAQLCLQRIAMTEWLTWRIFALQPLAGNFPGDPVVRKWVMAGLDRKALVGSIDPEMLIGLAAKLHDPEIDAKAAEYDRTSQHRIWVRAFFRRNLPEWNDEPEV